MASVMVIACDVKFSDSLRSDQLDSFNEEYGDSSFELSEDGLYMPMYEWFQQQFFEADLDELYEFCRSEHVKLKGNIYMIKREVKDGDYQQVHVKLGSKVYEMIDCTFSINVRKGGANKRKVLSNDDKLALFKEYWESKQRIPNSNEVYKDFRIGSFYATCKKNSDMMDSLNSILKDK